VLLLVHGLLDLHVVTLLKNMSVTNSLYYLLTTSLSHPSPSFINNTAGFAGDDAPRSVFPSLIGRARQPGIMVRQLIVLKYICIYLLLPNTLMILQ
jgi:hypothetical protein